MTNLFPAQATALDTDRFKRDPDIETSASFKEKKFKFSIELNEGMLHDQVTAAIEGGSNYWARIKVGKHQPGWRNYFTAEFTDVESDNNVTHTLSIAKLKKGLLILQEKYPHRFAEIIQESGDANTGDALVQCALLGDIVYG